MVDQHLIETLLNWTSVIILVSFDKVYQESPEFLSLIQLFIDLLKEDSILTPTLKDQLQEIYQ